MFVLALSLYNTWNRGVFLLCKITNLLIYSNIFKKEKGCSLSKYLTQTRLEQAKKYLTEYPDKTLIEIAESIGYSDVYYFSKNFKKYYGISPSKYQEERKM